MSVNRNNREPIHGNPLTSSDGNPSLSSFSETIDRLVIRHVEKLKELHDIKYTSQRDREILESEMDSLLNGLIDILDSFDQMIQNIDDAVPPEDKRGRRILKNFATIRKKFSGLLQKADITPIVADAGKFVAGMHKAVGVEHSKDIPEDHIVRMEKRGYFWKSKILRPAEVVVSAGEKNPE